MSTNYLHLSTSDGLAIEVNRDPESGKYLIQLSRGGFPGLPCRKETLAERDTPEQAIADALAWYPKPSEPQRQFVICKNDYPTYTLPLGTSEAEAEAIRAKLQARADAETSSNTMRVYMHLQEVPVWSGQS